MADIAVYYDKDDNALDAHADWLCARKHYEQLEFLLPRFERENLVSAVEFGPGSGLLAHAWKRKCPRLVYTGVEKSAKLLQIASSPECFPGNYGGLTFVRGDVRDYELPEADVGVAFTFLKHFGLPEWDDILDIVCNGLFRFACFDVPLAERDLDNGTDWPHVFVSPGRLELALDKAMFAEIERHTLAEWDEDGLGRIKNVAIWARRK